MSNRFGEIYTLTSFGESHGLAIGGVVDGMPSGVPISTEALQLMLDRRRPGQSAVSTPRREADRVEVLSGIYQGMTLGTPIGFIIRNTNQHSADYSEIERCYRPSHADYTYSAKYGMRDPRGGGRASARETAARVVAGALAMQVLGRLGITVRAYTEQIGSVALDADYKSLDLSLDSIDTNIVRCPDAAVAQAMVAEIGRARANGDSLGGIVRCVVSGVPAGLGDPVFGKLHARLASAMMSINAVKGFDYGLGFGFAGRRGSEVNDRFVPDGHGGIRTATNYSGGIQGGISNGEDICMRIAFKPVPTLMRDVDTVDTSGQPMVLHASGRHDPCVIPRAVPVVEAMAAMVVLDSYLINKTARF